MKSVRTGLCLEQPSKTNKLQNLCFSRHLQSQARRHVIEFLLETGEDVRHSFGSVRKRLNTWKTHKCEDGKTLGNFHSVAVHR